MKHYIKSLVLAAFTWTGIPICHGQIKEENKTDIKSHQRVSIVISHSHIPAANSVNGDKRMFVAASLGVNYEVWLNRRWGVGLHNDITMQSFNIEKRSGEEIVSRDFPVLATLAMVYKPFNHWIFLAGPGIEFEKNENFRVIKTGVEYSIEIPKKWEIGFGIEYDRKLRGYSSWLAGIGISKIFSR
jgi:hypothetical protein